MGVPNRVSPRTVLLVVLFLTWNSGLGHEHWSIKNGVASQEGPAVLYAKDFAKISKPLYLDQAEAAIDLQFLKLSNLQHHFNVSNFHPEVFEPVTLFRRKSSVSLAIDLCQQLELPVLSVENISIVPELPVEVLLDIEIAVGLRSLTCSTSHQLYKDEHCLSYVLSHSKSRLFFPDIFEFREFLIQTYLDKTVTLVLNQTHLSVTPNLYGNYACLGSFSLPEFSVSQIFHEIFRQGLYDSQVMHLSSLDDRLGLLADIVHSFALESSVLHVEDPSLDTISQIQDLALGYLPNVKYYQTSFYRFEAFFSEKVIPSHEKALSALGNPQFLKTLSSRSQAKLLGFLKLFHYSLNARLGTLLSSLSNSKLSRIPRTLLFGLDHNPANFVHLIRNLEPKISDNILIESFMIIQNLKQVLLSDLASLTEEPFQRNFLSLTEFFKFSDKGEIPELASFNRTNSRPTFPTLEDYGLNSTLLKIIDQFSDLTSALDSAYLFREALLNQTRAQGKLASLVSEYMNIMQESIRISQLIDTVQGYVDSFSSQKINPSFFSMTDLRNLVPKYLEFSLLSTTSNLYFTESGYVVEFLLPEYSELLKVYYLSQAPTLINNNWYSVPNLKASVILSQTFESTDYLTMVNSCSQKKGVFLCSNSALALKKIKEPDCSEQIVLSQHFGNLDLSRCRLERTLPLSNQKHVIRGERLLIANPFSKDSLSISCSNDSYSIVLDIGLSSISLTSGCSYETSELLVLTNSALRPLSSSGYFEGFESIPMAFEPNFSNYTDLDTIIGILSKDRSLEGMPLSLLKTKIEHLQLRLSLENLQPLSLDFGRPDGLSNYVTILFWGEFAIVIILTVVLVYLFLPLCGLRMQNWVRASSFRFYPPRRVDQASSSSEEPTSYL